MRCNHRAHVQLVHDLERNTSSRVDDVEVVVEEDQPEVELARDVDRAVLVSFGLVVAGQFLGREGFVHVQLEVFQVIGILGLHLDEVAPGLDDGAGKIGHHRFVEGLEGHGCAIDFVFRLVLGVGKGVEVRPGLQFGVRARLSLGAHLSL